MAPQDQILLRECDGVVGDPVQHQPEAKLPSNEHEYPWHPGKDLRLHLIGGCRFSFCCSHIEMPSRIGSRPMKMVASSEDAPAPPRAAGRRH